jgi:hypothetical protein
MYVKHNPFDELDTLYFIISKTEQLKNMFSIKHKTISKENKIDLVSL